MIIGIQLSSVQPYMQTEADVRASLYRLADMGYRAVQLQWTGEAVRPAFLADVLKECGMSAVSVQDYSHVILEDTDRFLRLADACRFGDITVSGVPETERTKEGVRAFAQRLTVLHDRLRKEGITLSFHPRWQELVPIEDISVLAMLLAESDETLRVLPDVNHIIRAGLDAPAFLASYAGRIDMLHCKDMRDASRVSSHLTVVGQGCVDWPPILSAARTAGVRYAFVEQENWDNDAFDCMRESRRYLDALLAP